MKRILLLSVLLAVCATARGDDYLWTGGNGDFNTPQWRDYTTSVDHVGPPGSADRGYIPADSIVTSGGATVDEFATAPDGGVLNLNGTFIAIALGSLNLSGTGTLTAQTLGSITLDGVSDDGSFIAVAGGRLTLGTITSTPSIRVTGGGAANVSGDAPTLGALTVDGTGSQLTLAQPTTATSLNVTGGALANLTIAATSTLTSLSVSGAGSVLNGVVAVASGTVNAGADFEGSVNPASNLVVDGTGTKAKLTIANFDGGSLRITGGAAVSTRVLYVRNSSAVTVFGAGTTLAAPQIVNMQSDGGGVTVFNVTGGASMQTAGFDVTSNSSSQSAINVTDGGTLRFRNNFRLGGDLTVSGGGQVIMNGDAAKVALGYNFSAPPRAIPYNCTVSLDGAGTLMDMGNSTVNMAAGTSPQEGGTTCYLSLADSAVMSAADLHVGAVAAYNGNVVGGEMAVAIGSGATLNVGSIFIGAQPGTATVSVDDTGHLNVRDSLGIGAGTLNVSGDVAAPNPLNCSGALNVSAPGTFTTGSGPGSAIYLGAGAMVTVTGEGASCDFDGDTYLGSYEGSYYGAAIMNVSGGAAAHLYRALLGGTYGTGILNVFNGGSSVAVTGELTMVGAGWVAVNDDALLTVGGPLFITPGHAVTVAPVPLPDGSTPTNGGRVSIGTDNRAPAGTVRVGLTGLLTGSATSDGKTIQSPEVSGNLAVGVGGTVRLTNGPGIFTVTGDGDLSDAGAGGGSAQFSIGGTGAAGTNYDALRVGGTATLGGTLRLILLPGYTPRVGDHFDLIQAGKITGAFERLKAPGLTFTVAQANGVLTATLTGVDAVPAPVITSATALRGDPGVPFFYQIETSTAACGYQVSFLPPGLSFDPAAGVISGVPEQANDYRDITISATNASGTGTAAITIQIGPPPPDLTPVITSATMASGVVGTDFTYQVTATNQPTSYGAIGLPPGLHLGAYTGLLAGTPTRAGEYHVTLRAFNSSGIGMATLALTVLSVSDASPAITSPANATAVAGTAFSYQITATNAPTRFSALGLPGGLKIAAATGLISGTPTQAGKVTITLGAANSYGTGVLALVLTVKSPAPGLPVITSARSASGKVGEAFSYGIQASNAPTLYSALGIPPGLRLDARTGVLSGVPTRAGTSTVTLRAANVTGTGEAMLTLRIVAVIPVVTAVPAGDGQAVEGGGKGRVLVRRTGDDASLPLTVRYKAKGTAVAGVDYKALPGSVTIPAGASQAKIKIKPIDNTTHDGTRKVKIKLLPATDGSYTVGAPFVAPIRIVDDD